MSTVSGPNLDAARRAVERLMDDTCTLLRGRDDSHRTLDRQSVAVLTPEKTTYYDGPCLLKAIGSPGEDYVGGNQTVYLRYELSIPIPANSAGEPQPGDIAVMTSSRRDPGSVGLRLRVMSAEYKTFATSRKLQCEVYTPATDRP